MARKGQVAFEMSAETEAAVRNLNRAAGGVDKLVAEMRQLKTEGAAAKKASTYSDSAISNVGRMVAQYASMAAAITAAKTGLEAMVRMEDQAAQRSRQEQQGIGFLAQIAGGDEQRFQQLRAQNRAYFLQGAAETEAAAASDTFAFVSAGVDQYQNLFGRMKAAGVLGDPASLARGATAITSAVGEAEAGSGIDVMSKVFAAGSASKFSAEEIAKEAAKAGVVARNLKWTDEDLLAGMVALSDVAGPSEAATQLKSFGAGIAELMGDTEKMSRFGLSAAQLRGRSLPEQARALGDLGLDFAEYQTLLGRKEGVYGMLGLSSAEGIERFRSVREDVFAADASDVVLRLADPVMNDPELRAALDARRARAEKRLAQRQQAIAGNLSSQFMDLYETQVMGGEEIPFFGIPGTDSRGARLALARFEHFVKRAVVGTEAAIGIDLHELDPENRNRLLQSQVMLEQERLREQRATPPPRLQSNGSEPGEEYGE